MSNLELTYTVLLCRKLIGLLQCLIKKSFEFLDAPSSITDFIHQSGLPSLCLCGLVPISIGRHENYRKCTQTCNQGCSVT